MPAVVASGTFHYSASVVRNRYGLWQGRAEAPADRIAHPGLFGSSPEIDVADGLITIRRTEGRFGRHGNVLYLRRAHTASRASIAVGSAIEDMLHDGDVLSVFQTGTRDLGVTVFRHNTFQAAIGAVSRVSLGEGIYVEEDPRARAFRPSGIAGDLDGRDCELVWLNASEPDHALHIRKVDEASAPKLVLAFAGGTAEDRRRLHQFMATRPAPAHRTSCLFVDVEGSFASAEQWLEHIHSLPTSRPRNLWIRVGAGSEQRELRENDYAFAPPYHLFVLRIYRWGHPDELSQLAIVRDSPALSRQAVIETTKIIASRKITIK